MQCIKANETIVSYYELCIGVFKKLIGKKKKFGVK